MLQEVTKTRAAATLSDMSVQPVKIQGWQCKCERCGHAWQSVGGEPPVRCANPKCKSPYWKTPARKKAAAKASKK